MEDEIASLKAQLAILEYDMEKREARISELESDVRWLEEKLERAIEGEKLSAFPRPL